MPWLAPPSLPFRWISTYVKHREHDRYITLDGEVHRVWEASEQRSADAGTEILVCERAIGNPVVGGAKLVESRWSGQQGIRKGRHRDVLVVVLRVSDLN